MHPYINNLFHSLVNLSLNKLIDNYKQYRTFNNQTS